MALSCNLAASQLAQVQHILKGCPVNMPGNWVRHAWPARKYDPTRRTALPAMRLVPNVQDLASLARWAEANEARYIACKPSPAGPDVECWYSNDLAACYQFGTASAQDPPDMGLTLYTRRMPEGSPFRTSAPLIDTLTIRHEGPNTLSVGDVKASFNDIIVPLHLDSAGMDPNSDALLFDQNPATYVQSPVGRITLKVVDGPRPLNILQLNRADNNKRNSTISPPLTNIIVEGSLAGMIVFRCMMSANVSTQTFRLQVRDNVLDPRSLPLVY